MVKRRIKVQALKIIENEFFREYEYVFKNIRSVIECFSGKNQVLSWDDFYSIVSNPNFIMINIDNKNIYDKFKVLYEIGFIGVSVTKDFKEKYTIIHDHAFIFNEDRYIFVGIKDPEFFNCKFIVHPIFTEKLRLIMNTPELLCVYNWDYLGHIERLGEVGIR